MVSGGFAGSCRHGCHGMQRHAELARAGSVRTGEGAATGRQARACLKIGVMLLSGSAATTRPAAWTPGLRAGPRPHLERQQAEGQDDGRACQLRAHAGQALQHQDDVHDRQEQLYGRYLQHAVRVSRALCLQGVRDARARVRRVCWALGTRSLAPRLQWASAGRQSRAATRSGSTGVLQVNSDEVRVDRQGSHSYKCIISVPARQQGANTSGPVFVCICTVQGTSTDALEDSASLTPGARRQTPEGLQLGASLEHTQVGKGGRQRSRLRSRPKAGRSPRDMCGQS